MLSQPLHSPGIAGDQTFFEGLDDNSCYEYPNNVLIKLQSVGEDPLHVMETYRFKMAKHDCLDMLRFMVHIENMNVIDLKEKL